MIKNKKRAIPNFFIALVLAGGISWICGKFIHLGDVEYTDNAQVKQHLSPINTRVQGFIKKIYFESANAHFGIFLASLFQLIVQYVEYSP